MVIPKGMRIKIPVQVLQMDPEYWPNPERFDPDRYEIKTDNTMEY